MTMKHCLRVRARQRWQCLWAWLRTHLGLLDRQDPILARATQRHRQRARAGVPAMLPRPKLHRPVVATLAETLPFADERGAAALVLLVGVPVGKGGGQKV